MPKPRKKIKLTWTELRLQRNALERFEMFLPMLQLKQQQLQSAVLETREQHGEVKRAAEAAEEKISAYLPVFKDTAGIHVRELSEPEEIQTTTVNIGGVKVPEFESATFPRPVYSLFGTPPWVDQALADLRERNRYLAELEVVEQKLALLQAELKKVTQRVNLFEKVIIPQAREHIRRIRIALGDRMTAAVARAKIAKEKLQKERGSGPEVESV